VSYLRKSGKNSFIYPSVPDIAYVDVEDITALLPDPAAGGSDRNKEKKMFKFPFHKMLVK